MRKLILTILFILGITVVNVAQDYPFYRNIDMNNHTIKNISALSIDTLRFFNEGPVGSTKNTMILFRPETSETDAEVDDQEKFIINYAATTDGTYQPTTTIGIPSRVNLIYDYENATIKFAGPPLSASVGAFIFDRQVNIKADLVMQNKYLGTDIASEELGLKYSIRAVKEIESDSAIVGSKLIVGPSATVNLSGAISIDGTIDANGSAIQDAGSVLLENGSYIDETGIYVLGLFNGMDVDSLVDNARKINNLNVEDLANVDTTGLTDGYILKWNEAGQVWTAAPDGGSSGGSSEDFIHYVYHTIENPTSSENLTLLVIPTAATIDSVLAFVVGSSPSVTFNVNHDVSRVAGSPATLFSSAQECTNTTTGAVYTTFNDATLAANEKLWLVTTATSGTVSEFNIVIYYH